MTLTIPSKSDKQASQLRDSLRILAWQSYKSENSVSGLDGYEKFNNEWTAHEVRHMNLTEIVKFIKTLGYTETELLQIRSEYYKARNEAKGFISSVNEEIPY